MDQKPRVETFQDLPVSAHMIKMSMRIDDMTDFQPTLLDRGDNPFSVITGVHHHTFTGLFATQNETVDG
jgi:hypothetical protein